VSEDAEQPGAPAATAEPLPAERAARPQRVTASAVVAALDEEDNVRPFYERLAPVMDALFADWELVVVDDGSTDRTAAILRELNERDPRVRCVRLSRNYGSHAAIAAGLDHARGDLAVALAADLQDPPETIPELVARWRDGYEIVWGARSAREDPPARRLFAKLFYGAIRRAALPGIPRTGTGSFCLIDRSVIDAFRRFPERNRITFGIVSWTGFAQTQVPYVRAARHAGRSKWSFSSLVKAAVDTFVSFSYVPIRLISYFGIAVSLLAFLFVIYVILDYAIAGTALRGWPSLMAAILFLGGVQLVTLGVIGEYVWRIAEESKRRPLYLVRERIGVDEPPPG
jgi:glycosyltransferase involved in cell wall biosynthesis